MSEGRGEIKWVDEGAYRSPRKDVISQRWRKIGRTKGGKIARTAIAVGIGAAGTYGVEAARPAHRAAEMVGIGEKEKFQQVGEEVPDGMEEMLEVLYELEEKVNEARAEWQKAKDDYDYSQDKWYHHIPGVEDKMDKKRKMAIAEIKYKKIFDEYKALKKRYDKIKQLEKTQPSAPMVSPSVPSKESAPEQPPAAKIREIKEPKTPIAEEVKKTAYAVYDAQTAFIEREINTFAANASAFAQKNNIKDAKELANRMDEFAPNFAAKIKKACTAIQMKKEEYPNLIKEKGDKQIGKSTLVGQCKIYGVNLSIFIFAIAFAAQLFFLPISFTNSTAHAQSLAQAPDIIVQLPPAQTQPVRIQPIKGLEITAEQAGLRKKNDTRNLQFMLGRVLGAVLALLGIVFFGLTIYAGISWMIARGNTNEAEAARTTLTNAAIGLIIVIISYAITQFILSIFTS